LAKELDFRPRKSLGQNFVHDANTVRRIATASGVNRHDHVLEVGPGLGSLTLALLDRGSRVTAVEIDPVLCERLPKTVAEHSHSEAGRLNVLHHDILTLTQADIEAMPDFRDQPTAVVANLPYNVAVPAILHLFAEFPTIRTVMVMVQAEVAERLAAEPGGKDYGVPSAKVRFYGDVRRYGMVSPTVFWPIPRVHSGLVRIDRYERPAAKRWPTDAEFRNEVFKLIDIAFAQRRKTSRNAFAEWAGSGNESAERLLTASINPALRGEMLAIEDFVRLLQRSGWQPTQQDANYLIAQASGPTRESTDLGPREARRPRESDQAAAAVLRSNQRSAT
jgi:16S rRNA (adenine1518-N6/adenine1519-N6)-dimethyltransferase